MCLKATGWVEQCVHMGGDDMYSEEQCLNLVLCMKLQVWSCSNPSPLRTNACRMHDQGIKLGGVVPKFGCGACPLLMQQLSGCLLGRAPSRDDALLT